MRRRALGPIGRLEDFIPYKLAVVANRVSQSIGHLFETQFNLQMPEWRILMALYAYGDLVFNEVVERTSMDKARVSRANRRLIDLGLIGTIDDPKDGRKRDPLADPRRREASAARSCPRPRPRKPGISPRSTTSSTASSTPSSTS